jgi:hypothetical protein
MRWAIVRFIETAELPRETKLEHLEGLLSWSLANGTHELQDQVFAAYVAVTTLH